MPSSTYLDFGSEKNSRHRMNWLPRPSLKKSNERLSLLHAPPRGSDALSTKPQVVFDASSHRKEQDPLNVRLTKGVDLNSSIVSMMIRFLRAGRFAAIANLKKAFLQVRIHYTNRDFLRFLWVDGSGRLAVYQMTLIPFGATCSPFLLAVGIRYHLLKHVATTTVAKQLMGRLYVDDLIVTAKTPAEMSKIHDDSIVLFDQCSMHNIQLDQV